MMDKTHQEMSELSYLIARKKGHKFIWWESVKLENCHPIGSGEIFNTVRNTNSIPSLVGYWIMDFYICREFYFW